MLQGVAGFNCVLKAGGNTVGKAQDVELPMTATEVDTSTRDGAGWKSFIQGLKEWGATIDHLWVPSNAAYQALRDAFLNGTEIAVEFEDDGGDGFSGNALVMGLTLGQPLDDAVTIPITIKGNGALSVLSGS
jgi:predicted secreted protein